VLVEPIDNEHRTVVGDVWRLYAGDDLIADLVVTEADFPWLYSRFVPLGDCAAVRSLFDEELRLLELDDDVDAWESAYREVTRAVALAAPDGRRVPAFLLHVSGDEAWWRWSDEPFDDA
jgi:hypothetical protein